MEARPADPEPDHGFVDLAAVAGLIGIVTGALLLAPTDLGFDPTAGLVALFSWIPATLPAALLVLAASIVDVSAGLVLARAVRGRPFEKLDEALLQGTVAAVLKDVVLLGLLAGSGFFTQPILIAIHAAILVAGLARVRPLIARAAVPAIDRVTPLGILIVAAWSAPVLLQLASPVVPFLDVLPNHVAPAEHLRTFGSLGLLTETQSPIYGPSRVFLGYTAWLGTITTGTGLPAGETLAGFILPSTLLVAVAVHRLVTAIGGRDAAAWGLLVFAMTTSFARLGDARATVVVLPLVAWPLAVLAERIAATGGADVRRADVRRGGVRRAAGLAGRLRRLPGDPWLPDGVALGLALGGAVLVHPVIGFLAALTVGIVVLAVPDRAAGLGVPALGAAAAVAVPQAATMLGVGLPPLALVAAIAGGVAVGWVLDALSSVRAALVLVGRAAAAGLAVLAVVAAGPLIRAAVAGAGPLLTVMELSLVAGVAGIALGARPARSPVLWAALGAGFGVAALTQLVPEEGSGLLGQALRFELPKTLQYWVPVFAALLAAGGLAAVLRANRLPLVARGVAIVAFVGTAALPIRTTPIDVFHLGEHRLSETFSIAMRWVESGFWSGFPDSRYVVDPPRREILAAVRLEIDAGDLRAETPVLHVATSFQQWVATPLGVFAGVTETVVSPDAQETIHTVGGRLRPVDDLAGLLSGGRYPYLLFEPGSGDLPPDTRDRIVAAGYVPVFANGQGELFRLAGS